MHTENDGILHSQTFDPDTKNQEMLGEGALCFRRQNTLLGGVIYMTVWDSSNEDKRSVRENATRARMHTGTNATGVKDSGPT